MARMSPQRQAVLDLVQREGRISPKRVAEVLGMNPSAARKLLLRCTQTALFDAQ